MSVPSVEFLAFALAGALLCNFFPAARGRALVLFGLNCAFFCSFLQGWLSALPYLGFLVLGFAGARILRVHKSTPLLLLLVAAVLYVFFLLKRYSFIPATTQLSFWYSTIGLSYVFFRVMHVLIDVHQDAIAEPITPLSYFNYVLNFPALVSGPIQRYQDYHETEEGDSLPLNAGVVGRSIERIVYGFFKVTVVSTLLLTWQKAYIVSLSPTEPLWDRARDLALIAGLYPLYLYANFSGYTDFVIGIARLFRIELPENFNDPFSSENFISFWSRWHITLSNWLKEYVYMPLLMALMRRLTAAWIEPYLAVFAYFVTFFLVGAWHGQTTMFLFFGVLQGGGVAANKLYQIAMAAVLSQPRYRALCANRVYRACSRGLTYAWFAFTLFWFWSDWNQLAQIVTAAGPAVILAGVLLLLGVATLVLGLRVYLEVWLRVWRSEPLRIWEAVVRHRYARTAWVTALALATVTVLNVLGGSPPDLVYKNF